MKHVFYGIIAGTAALALLGGCHTANVTESVQVHPDDDPLGGAINSADIRTVASQMTPAILALPEIADKEGPVRIAVADFKNNSRFIIDRNIFMKRLQLELNRTANGKVRFFSQSANVQKVRVESLTERQEDLVRAKLAELGKEIAANPLFANSPKPVKIAVIPALNTNLVNMNADSFAAMLRSEIANASGGKIQFLMPGEVTGADYYLTGQFVPESIKSEGIINLANYIQVIEARLKRGQSLDITDGRVPDTSRTTPLVEGDNNIEIKRESELVKLMTSPEMQAKPNVNKRFNVMIVKPDEKVAVYEKMMLIDRKIDSGLGKADYILSGEISALSQRAEGKASDYLLISVQLTNPETNETVWEDAFETKRMTQAGIVYQ